MNEAFDIGVADGMIKVAGKSDKLLSREISKLTGGKEKGLLGLVHAGNVGMKSVEGPKRKLVAIGPMRRDRKGKRYLPSKHLWGNQQRAAELALSNPKALGGRRNWTEFRG